jgi:hypothetical protein
MWAFAWIVSDAMSNPQGGDDGAFSRMQRLLKNRERTGSV